MSIAGDSLPPIVIGCDYGLAFDLQIQPDDPLAAPIVDFTGWALDADVLALTREGLGAPLASNVMSWVSIATGVAKLVISNPVTEGFTPGRAFIRPIAIRPDGVRIPASTPILVSVERSGTTV
jgi:hypothetical protein